MTWIGCVLPVGDELYIYYGGYKRGHKVAKDTERQIGMTKMTMDRVVSWDAAGESTGRLITVPLRLPVGARRLLLNANASGGKIRVQFKDALGNRVLAGYGLDDCTPVTSDGQATRVACNAVNLARGGVDVSVCGHRKNDLLADVVFVRTHKQGGV
jgi:hypothetical protein